jgi:aminomethyltransferase
MAFAMVHRTQDDDLKCTATRATAGPYVGENTVMTDVEFDVHALRRDYGDIRAEAGSCRFTAALFDFSFMRRIRVRGPGASGLVQTLTPRGIDDLMPGRVRYALRVGAGGRVLDDVTIWRLDAECFEIFAATGDALAHLQAVSTASVCDLSQETAILAVQGPSSLRALAGVTPSAQLRALPYFGHTQTSIAGVACSVGRLGYTGERGFEIILPRSARDAIWTLLARHARPAGFAAADILRIEAGFPLFANEFRFPTTVAELGLERFAAGRKARRTRQPVNRAGALRLTSFEAVCDDDPILWQPPRDATFPPVPGSLLVTSACRSVVTGGILGLGYACAAHRLAHFVDPMGQFRDIREVSLPFYDPRKRQPRGGWGDDLLPEGDGRPHSLG